VARGVSLECQAGARSTLARDHVALLVALGRGAVLSAVADADLLHPTPAPGAGRADGCRHGTGVAPAAAYRHRRQSIRRGATADGRERLPGHRRVARLPWPA
jgi:hypothetical protein